MARGIVNIIVDDSDNAADAPEADFDKVGTEIESRRERYPKQRGIVGVDECLEHYFEDCG
jgi:hypothetical protein